MKYLIWLVIVLAVVTWFKRTVAKLSGNQGAAARNNGRAEVMCPCAHCGTYFPASEAIRDSTGSLFCCKEHRVRHAHG